MENCTQVTALQQRSTAEERDKSRPPEMVRETNMDMPALSRLRANFHTAASDAPQRASPAAHPMAKSTAGERRTTVSLKPIPFSS
mmetsp:Transcript_51205/g.141721  ORF Transcript_51205/g.141721 Transcript_51205/m.141721 type:complete len:85 (-) Transcript_51205:533-787(-)